MKLIQIWFDGGCKPNPGAGYGSYLIKSSTVQIEKLLLQHPGLMTCNTAEYQTMIQCLKKCWHECEHGGWKELVGQPKECRLQIHSDSKLLVQQVNGRWKIKTRHIEELARESQLWLGLFGAWCLNWNPRQVNVNKFGH